MEKSDKFKTSNFKAKNVECNFLKKISYINVNIYFITSISFMVTLLAFNGDTEIGIIPTPFSRILTFSVSFYQT